MDPSTALPPELELLTPHLPPAAQAAVRALGRVYLERTAALTAAYHADLKAALAGQPPTALTRLAQGEAPPRRKPGSRPVGRHLLGLAALRVYDLLVRYEFREASSVTFREVVDMLRPAGPAGGKASRGDNARYLGELRLSVVNLAARGLIGQSPNGTRVWHVPAPPVQYQDLLLTPRLAVRLCRLRRPATVDELCVTMQATALPKQEVYVSKVRQALRIARVPFARELVHDTWALVPDFFSGDPPVARLPDEGPAPPAKDPPP